MMAKEDRGFASMDRNKQREIASKGGRAAHSKGTAHEWTSEEAREAGRKGGMASHRKSQPPLGPDPLLDPLPNDPMATVVPDDGSRHADSNEGSPRRGDPRAFPHILSS